MITSRDRVKDIRERVEAAVDAASSISNLKAVLEAESAQLVHAEASCCAGVRFQKCLRAEVQLLREALAALEEGDSGLGIARLRDYEKVTQPLARTGRADTQKH